MGSVGVIADKTSDAIMDALAEKNYTFVDFDKNGANGRIIIMEYREYNARIKLEIEVGEKSESEVMETSDNNDGQNIEECS